MVELTLETIPTQITWCGRRDVDHRTSAQRRFVRQLSVSDVGPMLDQRQANNGAMLPQPPANVGVTLAQRLCDIGLTYFANILPTFWSTFYQLSADRLPTFGWWYSHVMFLTLNIIFNVLKMSRKYHISKHILVHALKHDIPMTSLRYQGNMSVTSQTLSLLVIFFCPPTCTHRHEPFRVS